MHTYRVEIHVDFSSIVDVMGCGSKLVSCKSKVDSLRRYQPMKIQEFLRAMA